MKKRFEVPVAVHIIIKKDDKILFQRRKNTKFGDGNLCLPAGHLENGESVYGAIIREVKEELNIDIDNKTLNIIFVSNRKGTDKTRIDYFFKVDCYAGEIINNEPCKCSELKWLNINEIMESKEVMEYIKKFYISYINGCNFSVIDF